MDLTSLEHGALVKIISLINSGKQFIKYKNKRIVVIGDTFLYHFVFKAFFQIQHI